MATLDTRKFLDYNGLEAFWTGIKNRFAEQSTVTVLQSDVDELTAQFNTLNGTITEQLEQILADISQRSPLTSNNYTSACELAQTALMGSVIYVKDSDENGYAAGPYIVTANRNLLYINTHEGNVDFDNIDVGALLGEIAGIKESVESIKNNYATKDELQEAIANIQGSINGVVKIQVVSELPENGELGTIYLMPNNLNANNLNGSYNTFTEYIYVEHNGIKMYEKIGVGLEDLKNYVKSDTFTEKIQEINDAIVAAKSDAIATVQSSIISKDDNSFGNTMSISTSDIEKLLNA
jgi:hypothetical protein